MLVIDSYSGTPMGPCSSYLIHSAEVECDQVEPGAQEIGKALHSCSRKGHQGIDESVAKNESCVPSRATFKRSKSEQGWRKLDVGHIEHALVFRSTLIQLQ
jgi:hypothetical protein